MRSVTEGSEVKAGLAEGPASLGYGGRRDRSRLPEEKT
jgi:hypothetical protein